MSCTESAAERDARVAAKIARKEAKRAERKETKRTAKAAKRGISEQDKAEFEEAQQKKKENYADWREDKERAEQNRRGLQWVPELRTTPLSIISGSNRTDRRFCYSSRVNRKTP